MEILIIGIAGIFFGAVIGRVLFKNFKIIEKIETQILGKTLNDPEKLKQRLEENGEIVDMGEKLEFKIKKNKEGKEILDIERKKIKVKEKKQIKSRLMAPISKEIPISLKEEVSLIDNEIKQEIESEKEISPADLDFFEDSEEDLPEEEEILDELKEEGEAEEEPEDEEEDPEDSENKEEEK